MYIKLYVDKKINFDRLLEVSMNTLDEYYKNFVYIHTINIFSAYYYILNNYKKINFNSQKKANIFNTKKRRNRYHACYF